MMSQQFAFYLVAAVKSFWPLALCIALSILAVRRYP
jgi:hypothetical protein